MGRREREFAELYTLAWPRLLRTTYGVTGDRQLAEDALQTAFAKAYAAWPRVSRADDPVAYVRRMAINAAFAQHRRAAVRHEVAVPLGPERRDLGADGPLRDDEVWCAVQTLPPRQRAVVVLRYYEDLSEAQIADALGCRPGTVKSQASAALAALRARLDADLPTREGERA